MKPHLCIVASALLFTGISSTGISSAAIPSSTTSPHAIRKSAGSDAAALVDYSTIMFVTSVPNTAFKNQLNTFGNHGTSTLDAVAGGDLYIRYSDGSLRNLTSEAGWGVASGGIQGGGKAISVRQPCVHWDGQKALFAMLVGGPTARFQVVSRKWQIYEVTGLAKGQTAIITKVANQPNYNNMSPIYGSDDQIIFTSDAPLYGMTHTYPQLDEYESSTTVTGIWKLNPGNGTVHMIEHAPSGAFNLFLDSYGRLIFTKWDHLKRDQEADLDRYHGGAYNPVDIADESPSAAVKSYSQYDVHGKLQADNKGVLYDVFPEARDPLDPTRNPNEALHDFNQFFIWQINEDGSGEETLNHVGRHEFGGTYMNGIFLDDPNLTDALGSFSANQVTRATVRADSGLFQLKEDPVFPGSYYGTYAQEFSRQAAGRIMKFTMAPGVNPENVVVTDLTNATLDDDPYGLNPPSPSMTGHYRDPLKLTNSKWLVSHTPEYRVNADTSADPLVIAPRYVFQIKPFVANSAGFGRVAGNSITGGLVKNIRFWTDAATPVSYNGPLNETDMVEVRSRPRPATLGMQTSPLEKTVLQEESVDETVLRNWLIQNNLALIVSRNMTSRDRADVQQPFNLRVPGGVVNQPKPGKLYDIQDLQIFQGDLTRGYSNATSGRRVHINPLHDSVQQPNVLAQNKPNPNGPEGSVKVASDGSMAAFVPAGRAITWQLTSPTGAPVVRERNWVSFAPGEIRTCASCHGVNDKTQEPKNKPKALRLLMRYWKTQTGL